MKSINRTLAISLVEFCLLILNAYSQVSFEQHLVDDNTHGMGSIYACDIDGDQDNDILAASLEDNQIIWCRNDGGTPIHWEKIVIASNVAGAHSVYAADLDNDGDLDVIGAAYQGQPGIAWWRNDSGDPVIWTKFPVANTFINAHEIYSADLNNDQFTDILGASSDLNKIAVWYNSGGDSITWNEQTLITNFTLAKSVRAGDIDGDGDIDVIGASIVDNDVLWWKNDDNGTPVNWTQLDIDLNFSGAHRVDTADINGDGRLDVVGAGYVGHTIGWWENNGGNPISWTRQIVEYNFINACIAYASDIDGDGDMDIIGTSQGNNIVAIWLNNGGNPIQWIKIIVDNDFYRVWPLYAADLDGDGDIDVIAGSSHQGNNQIRWYENLGDTTTSVDNHSDLLIPKNILIYQNYPNPFNPSTTIKFSIPERKFVQLKIYNMLGKEITTLVDEEKAAGEYEVEFPVTNETSVIEEVNSLTSGIYFYRLTVGDQTIVKKMIFLK